MFSSENIAADHASHVILPAKRHIRYFINVLKNLRVGRADEVLFHFLDTLTDNYQESRLDNAIVYQVLIKELVDSLSAADDPRVDGTLYLDLKWIMGELAKTYAEQIRGHGVRIETERGRYRLHDIAHRQHIILKWEPVQLDILEESHEKRKREVSTQRPLTRLLG